MFKNFFLSELKYSFRQPMLYLFFLIVFLLVFAANVTDNVTIGGSIGNVYRNAPNVITIYSIILTLFFPKNLPDLSASLKFNVSFDKIFKLSFNVVIKKILLN